MEAKNPYNGEFKDLLQNESLFISLSEFSPAGIYLTNKDGDCIYVNKKWEETAGLTAEKAYGKGWKEALHKDDLEEIFSKWYKVVETDGRWRFKYRFVNQETGTIQWLLGSAKPLYDEKKMLKGYMGMNIDIDDENPQDMLPICAWCKKIRISDTNWKDIDQYIAENTDTDITHGICPDCLKNKFSGFSNDFSN